MRCSPPLALARRRTRRWPKAEALAECVSDVRPRRTEPGGARARARNTRARARNSSRLARSLAVRRGVGSSSRSRWSRPVAASSGRRCATAAVTTCSAASAPAGDRHRQPENRPCIVVGRQHGDPAGSRRPVRRRGDRRIALGQGVALCKITPVANIAASPTDGGRRASRPPCRPWNTAAPNVRRSKPRRRGSHGLQGKASRVRMGNYDVRSAGGCCPPILE
jgi:hypothetical protein